ncbi:MAG TPA: trypsin-like peptidase domain-containing protein, partial [Ignavibacteria bacterium]|nr:trypsin-like peptidase domain-containing protein [Ignavibacteria bacterium]
NLIKYIWLLAAFMVTFTAFNSSAVYAQEKSNEPLNRQMLSDSSNFNAEQIIERNKSALISIWYHTDNYYSYFSYSTIDTTLLNGSGFIFSEDGLIGTNYHVVDGIDSLIVKTADGTYYDAELLIIDEKNDMAIIRIKNANGTKFPTIKFGNSDAIKVGQEVFAIGSPLGYEYTISQGIIAGIRDNEKVSFTDPVTYSPIEKSFEKVLQITAAISPGNSGGALFNRKGEVIGITTYTYSGYGNLNFAIAVNSFVYFMNSVDIANIDNNPEAKKKREESLYYSNLRLAGNYKSEATYNWIYVKQKDTMKVIDTFVVKQDSIARVNFNKAESFYYKCLDIAPDSFNVYRDMMDLYVYCENFPKAENLYDTIKARFQSDSLLNLLSSSLASAYTTSKDYKKALEFYEKMSKKDTSDNYLRYQIGTIYESMGKYNKAIKEYKKLIKKDPLYTQAYIQLGSVYFNKLKDYRTAKQYIEKAYDMEMVTYGSTYYLDIPYLLGMIACKERKKTDAMLYYMDLKSIYTYTTEDNKKKADLLKAIRDLN